MTVNTVNLLFMIALAIFSAVAAAVLAVAFERWASRRAERAADRDVPESARPIVEATKAFQSLNKVLSTRPRRNRNRGA